MTLFEITLLKKLLKLVRLIELSHQHPLSDTLTRVSQLLVTGRTGSVVGWRHQYARGAQEAIGQHLNR